MEKHCNKIYEDKISREEDVCIYIIDEDFHDNIDLFEPEDDDYPNDYYEGW